MFSLACYSTKTDVEFLSIEISSKKELENKVDISTIEITSKKVCGNNADFLKLHASIQLAILKYS